jgi:hypothetical protein
MDCFMNKTLLNFRVLIGVYESLAVKVMGSRPVIVVG